MPINRAPSLVGFNGRITKAERVAPAGVTTILGKRDHFAGVRKNIVKFTPEFVKLDQVSTATPKEVAMSDTAIIIVANCTMIVGVAWAIAYAAVEMVRSTRPVAAVDAD